MQDESFIGIAVSVGLHALIGLVAFLGVPEFLRSDPIIEDTPIIVEMVQIDEVTNLPPPTPKPKEEPKPKPEPKPEPPKPEPPKPEPPKPEPPKPEPPKPAPPEPPKPEPAPPEPVPAPEPAPAPEPPPEAPPEAKAPTVPPPPVVPKLPPKKKAEPDPFSQLLKSVDDLKKTPPPTPKTEDAPKDKPAEQTAKVDEQAFFNKVAKSVGSSNKPFDPGAKLSLSEIDAIRAQIERCWNVPIGVPRPEDYVVDVKIALNPDGVVRDARIVDTGRMNDPYFRTMAESAVRAVLACSPLKAPKRKYEVWKDINMTFNPAAMVGR